MASWRLSWSGNSSNRTAHWTRGCQTQVVCFFWGLRGRRERAEGRKCWSQYFNPSFCLLVFGWWIFESNGWLMGWFLSKSMGTTLNFQTTKTSSMVSFDWETWNIWKMNGSLCISFHGKRFWRTFFWNWHMTEVSYTSMMALEKLAPFIVSKLLIFLFFLVLWNGLQLQKRLCSQESVRKHKGDLGVWLWHYNQPLGNIFMKKTIEEGLLKAQKHLNTRGKD